MQKNKKIIPTVTKVAKFIRVWIPDVVHVVKTSVQIFGDALDCSVISLLRNHPIDLFGTQPLLAKSAT